MVAWQAARLLLLCDEKTRAKRDVRMPREDRQPHKAGPHLCRKAQVCLARRVIWVQARGEACAHFPPRHAIVRDFDAQRLHKLIGARVATCHDDDADEAHHIACIDDHPFADAALPRAPSLL